MLSQILGCSQKMWHLFSGSCEGIPWDLGFRHFEARGRFSEDIVTATPWGDCRVARSQLVFGDPDLASHSKVRSARHGKWERRIISWPDSWMSLISRAYGCLGFKISLPRALLIYGVIQVGRQSQQLGIHQEPPLSWDPEASIHAWYILVYGGIIT